MPRARSTVRGARCSGYLGDAAGAAATSRDRRPRAIRRRRLPPRARRVCATCSSPASVATSRRSGSSANCAATPGSARRWCSAKRGRTRSRARSGARADDAECGIAAAIAPRTRRLPDYARVRRWVRRAAALHVRRRHADGQRPPAPRRDPARARRRAARALYPKRLAPSPTDWNFHDVQRATRRRRPRNDRESLLSAPLIQPRLAVTSRASLHRLPHPGLPPRAPYGATADGRRCAPARAAWTGCAGRSLHYIDEEAGTSEWILDDIAAAGGDRRRRAPRRSRTWRPR